MKNWKRAVSLFLTASMMMLSMAACGGETSTKESTPDTSKQEEKTNTETVADEKTAEIEELLLWVPPMTPTGGDDTETKWRPMLEEFEKENNVKVSMEIIPWENYQEKYSTAINAGEGPDVGYMYAEMFPTFIDAKAIEDITPYLTDADYEKYTYLKQAEMFGGTYGIPIVAGVPFVMYYNQDILDSLGETAPETWEDFERICKAATQDTDGDGKLDQYGFSLGWNTASFGSMNSNWYMWLWQAGGDIFNEDLKSVRFNDEAGLEAANFLMSLKPYMPEEAMSLSTTDAFQKIFGQGKAAFGVTRSSQIQDTQFKETYPELNWDYVTSLQHKSYGTFGAVDSLTLMSKCENKELGVALMKYITDAPFQTEYHKTSPGAPLTKEEPYQGDEKMKRIVSEDVDKYRPLTVGPKGVEIYDYLWKQLQMMFEGTQTPQESLDEAARFANELLTEYWEEKE